jgi:predicted AAA+ superfamily ATPase
MMSSKILFPSALFSKSFLQSERVVDGVDMESIVFRRFYRMYKSNPCLWKVRAKKYSDKNKKVDYWPTRNWLRREKDPVQITKKRSKNQPLTKFI